MQGLGAIGIIFTGLIGAVLVTWIWWRFIGRGMAQDKKSREKLALLLSQAYRQKLEEDRKYALAWANIALQRERLYLGGRKVSEVAPAQIAAPHPVTPPTFAALLADGIIGRLTMLLLGYADGATELFIILQSVLQGAKLLIIDPHRDTAQDSLGGRLAPLAACFMRPIASDDEKDVLATIKVARREVDRRRRGATGTPLILVVDEFTRLMRRSHTIKDELSDCIEEIAQEGRKLGVFALLSGQIWKATGAGGTELRYSLASSFVHRIQEQQSKLLIPGEYAKLTPKLKTGQVYFYDTNGDTQLMQIPYTTEEDVMTVAGLLTSRAGFQPTSFQTSPRLPDTPGEVEAFPSLKLVAKAVEATFDDLPPELENKYHEVLALTLQEKKQGEIIAAVWGVTSGGGAAYQKAADELRVIQRMIAQQASQVRGA